MSETPQQYLSHILGCTVAQLDITVDDFQAAEQRYTDVGKYLADEGADVYVQGSFMLGTVVRPYGREGEYDLDLVSRIDVDKTSITQAELKQRVGTYLGEYLDNTEGVDGEVPELDESRRCWTLSYDRFHMDVLPAIPNRAAVSDTAILLTDKELRAWQHSDPLAYVNWFRSRCAEQFLTERAVLSKAAGTLDDVPEWRVRTNLHRVVQVLKRHRDVHFANDPDDRPPSSLITTLAAQGYDGEPDLIDAALNAVQRMPEFIVVRDGRFWVANPVSAGENFADKWNDYPQRRVKFQRWRGEVERVLTTAVEERGGAQAVFGHLEHAFGAEPVRKALAAYGDEQRQLRESGGMRMTSTGLVTTGAGIAVPRNHRFYGGRAHS